MGDLYKTQWESVSNILLLQVVYGVENFYLAVGVPLIDGNMGCIYLIQLWQINIEMPLSLTTDTFSNEGLMSWPAYMSHS